MAFCSLETEFLENNHLNFYMEEKLRKMEFKYQELQFHLFSCFRHSTLFLCMCGSGHVSVTFWEQYQVSTRRMRHPGTPGAEASHLAGVI